MYIGYLPRRLFPRYIRQRMAWAPATDEIFIQLAVDYRDIFLV
jgi:hypothetical protein